MLTRNPAALRIILTDDLYLIRKGGALAKPFSPPEIVQPEPAAAPPEEAHAVFTGNFSNGSILLFDEPGFSALSPASAEALQKVFAAKKTALQDWALINLAGQELSFDRLKKQFSPKKILLLGTDNRKTGFDDLAYNTPLIRDGIRILYTYTMADMLADNQRKKLFWEGFKLFIDA